ncbi:MAG: ABC transporter permease [Candidatus Peribacteraceae bacterium]|nr:ABC transporter permease [Candidatus Peribacteraceae bacterium]MDD5741886.1 ABC transporter permease [Candidatus Peribacteraceae bacterium]
MLFRDTIRTATQGITRNISRSLLTTLGIVIGVGSVVLMVSMGSSFQTYILAQVSQFSGSTFEIHAKGLQEFGKATESISDADFDALSKLSTVTSAAPVVFVGQSVKYGKEEKKPTVFGTTKEIFPNLSVKLDHGRLLSDGDVKGASPVAVLASQTAEDLFGNQDPVDQRITIGTQKFTVVGVLASFGSALAGNLDTPVYIPITVAKAMTGKYQYVDYVSLQSKDDLTLTEIDIKSLLRQRHKITNPEDDPAKDDFIARSFAQATSVIGTVTLSITIFLGLIAAISLVVGGIGIMNIMLVSVSERTKEIGLRKAVGATRRNILLQFLLEAVTLTLLGGLIGLVGGATIGFLLARVASKFIGSFPYTLTPLSVILSVGMAVATGLVFGIYPAQRAAKLSPIEAMRFE